MAFRKTYHYPVLLTAVLVILFAVSGCGKKSEPAAARSKDVKCTTGQAGLQTVPPRRTRSRDQPEPG